MEGAPVAVGGRLSRCAPCFDPHCVHGVRAAAATRRGAVLVRAGCAPGTSDALVRVRLETAPVPRPARAEVSFVSFDAVCADVLLVGWSDGAVSRHALDAPAEGALLAALRGAVVALAVLADGTHLAVTEELVRGGRKRAGERLPGAIDDQTRTLRTAVYAFGRDAHDGPTAKSGSADAAPALAFRQKYRSACALSSARLVTAEHAGGDDGARTRFVVRDAQTLAEVRAFEAEGVATHVALLGDAVAWSDFGGRLWMHDGAQTRLVSHWHARTPLALAPSPAGLLVSGGEEGVLAVWDPRRPNVRQMLPHAAGAAVSALAVSPDGAHYALSTLGNSVVVVSAAAMGVEASHWLPCASASLRSGAALASWPGGHDALLVLDARPGCVAAVDAGTADALLLGAPLDVCRQNTIGRGPSGRTVRRGAVVGAATLVSDGRVVLVTVDADAGARRPRGRHARLSFFVGPSGATPDALAEECAVDAPHGDALVVGVHALRGAFCTVAADGRVRRWTRSASGRGFVLGAEETVAGVASVFSSGVLGETLVLAVETPTGQNGVVFLDGSTLQPSSAPLLLSSGRVRSAFVACASDVAAVAIDCSIWGVSAAGVLWHAALPSSLSALACAGDSFYAALESSPAALVALDARTGRPQRVSRHHGRICALHGLPSGALALADSTGSLLRLGAESTLPHPPHTAPSGLPVPALPRPRSVPAAPAAVPVARRMRVSRASALLSDVPTALLPSPLAALAHIVRSH